MKIRILVIVIPFTFLGCNNSSKVSDTTITQVSTDTLVIDTAMYAAMAEPEQLVRKHELTSGDLYRDYDGGSELSNYFQIELIDRSTFLANRNMGVNFLILDSATVTKENGVLRLPTEHGTLTLKDNLADNDKHKEYKYLGQLNPLDMYLVLGTFWEDWSYILFDKKRGREVQSFVGVPCLSADQKYIICLEVDSFEGFTNIALYAVSTDEITGRKYIDPIVETYAKSWIPIISRETLYWSTDGYLYLSVLYSSNYWDAQNNFVGLDQYIRLRPVA